MNTADDEWGTTVKMGKIENERIYFGKTKKFLPIIIWILVYYTGHWSYFIDKNNFSHSKKKNKLISREFFEVRFLASIY